MNATEAKQLQVGDHVQWTGTQPATGTVTAILANGVEIEWSDKKQYGGIHFEDMALVELLSRG